ncbi:MAG: hypothetical protein ACJ741_16135 [Pyrinomonadaceae bacterium]
MKSDISIMLTITPLEARDEGVAPNVVINRASSTQVRAGRSCEIKRGEKSGFQKVCAANCARCVRLNVRAAAEVRKSAVVENEGGGKPLPVFNDGRASSECVALTRCTGVRSCVVVLFKSGTSARSKLLPSKLVRLREPCAEGSRETLARFIPRRSL